MNDVLAISESDLFEAMSKKIGAKESKLLITYIKNVMDDTEDRLVTKPDLKVVLSEGFSDLKLDVKNQIIKLLLWQLAMWITTISLIITLAVVFFK